MAVHDKYSLLTRNNLIQPILMHLSQKQKAFTGVFCAFFKSTSNFEHFQKKITLLAYLVPKLRNANNMIR